MDAPRPLRFWLVIAAFCLWSGCGDAAGGSGSGRVDDGDIGEFSPDGDGPDGSGADGSGLSDDPDADADGDGLANRLEDLNANGVYDPDTNETNWLDPDTDGDGLDDGTEDANRNGRVDEGETDPRRADTDGDGIDDDDERGLGTDPTLFDTDGDGLGDGDERTIGTDPLNEDTDGDGLVDGDEERDADGEVDPFETSPFETDTDGDGTPDGEETLALACSRGTEPPTVRFGDLNLDFDLVAADVFGAPQRFEERSADDPLLGAAWSAHATEPLYAFVISKAPDSGEPNATSQAQSEIVRAARELRITSRDVRRLWSWDDLDGAFFRFDVEEPRALTAEAVLERWIGAALLVPEGRADGGPEPGDTTATDWVVTAFVARRSEARAVIVGTVTTRDVADRLAEVGGTDLSTGTVLAQFGDDLARGCLPFDVQAEAVPVDFLWVVDSSESMLDDRETVAATSNLFFDTLNTSFIDFRVAVVSTNMRNNEWLLVDPGFSRDLSDFQAQIRRPPVQFSEVAFEFGIETAENVIGWATSHFADPQVAFRPGARRVIVFMTDENDQTVKNLARDGEATCDAASSPGLEDCEFITSFIRTLDEAETTAFAITGDAPDGCSSDGGSGFASEAGAAYIRVAFETGGSFASICSGDLGEAVNRIVRAALGAASTYDIPVVPAASTLRVVRNGAVLPRSIVNGWDYDPVANQIVFYGDGRPALDDELAVGYRSWLDLTDDPTGYVPPE